MRFFPSFNSFCCEILIENSVSLIFICHFLQFFLDVFSDIHLLLDVLFVFFLAFFDALLVFDLVFFHLSSHFFFLFPELVSEFCSVLFVLENFVLLAEGFSEFVEFVDFAGFLVADFDHVVGRSELF